MARKCFIDFGNFARWMFAQNAILLKTEKSCTRAVKYAHAFVGAGAHVSSRSDGQWKLFQLTFSCPPTHRRHCRHRSAQVYRIENAFPNKKTFLGLGKEWNLNNNMLSIGHIEGRFRFVCVDKRKPLEIYLHRPEILNFWHR